MDEIEMGKVYEIRKGRDGKMKIFLKDFNVALAEFYENSASAQADFKEAIENYRLKLKKLTQ